MINVRLYQEIVVPYCNLKHGQSAAVALTRSGANKVLKKVWEAFITRKIESSRENMQKLFKIRESLTPSFKLPNSQPDSKLTKELMKTLLVLMLRSKAS